MKVLKPTFEINPSVLPDAKIGVPYSQILTANTQDSLTWSFPKPLPEGFSTSTPNRETLLIECTSPQEEFDAPVIIVADSGGGNFGIVKS